MRRPRVLCASDSRYSQEKCEPAVVWQNVFVGFLKVGIVRGTAFGLLGKSLMCVCLSVCLSVRVCVCVC